MKKIIVFVLIVISGASYSQTKKGRIFDCDDLNAIFSNSYFAQYVADLKDTLILVDTFKIFSCNKLLINGQPLVLFNKVTKEISHGDQNIRYLKSERKRFIAIWRVKTEKKRLVLSFWELKSNRLCLVYLPKRSGDRIKIQDYGAF